MSIQFFCPRWGSEALSWDLFCRKAKDDGYDGIEYGIASNAKGAELDEVWNAAEKAGLTLIAQHWDTIEPEFSKHYDMYCAWLEKIAPYPVVRINSQTGKDYYSFDQNKKLIEAAGKSSREVVHETHRNKFSFAAHITKDYLQRIPELRITLDASHWVCVAESFLDDQPEAMQLAIKRTAHVHARVGYPEGPQVTDPRIAANQFALEKHLAWWDQVVALKRKENAVLTITPEFGPFPYMVHDPIGGYPLSDQWAVNVYMMELLRERYDLRRQPNKTL